MVNTEVPKMNDIYKLLSQIKDPEIPEINIIELGILRNVEFENNKYKISITPTYSGCPAMKMIENQISEILKNNFYDFEIITNLSPAWTTDWMTDEGKKKLIESGITPPQKNFNSIEFKLNKINCPYCNSVKTILKSEFGSTACKSFYFCENCLTPFDYFKSI
ncbi:MAG: phenylacetate-CoA oxygenase subunit PaaJ [Bacteroidetes bacterium]|nr:phenylacetate-CoA oxygenase subunit PaaJ [Bacteroidota bacterium]